MPKLTEKLTDWWDGFWDNVKHSPAILPTLHRISSDHIDKQMGQRFKRDQHYFTIKVNRIALKYDREFWTTYAPMALVVSEFQYDGDDIVVPFVVGPSLLEKNQIELPDRRFMFLDTKVAGIHPYKGGGLKLTVILYKVKRTDLAKKLLKVVENMASVLDFSHALSAYLKIGAVLVETVGEVIGADADNQPLIGLRQEFGDADDIYSGYFALIEGKIEKSKLWVEDNALLYGDVGNASQFTDANYVLYSIHQTPDRDDFEKLSFYGQWKTALAEAHTANPEKWLSAKANWTTLYQMMSLSPDLISPHAENLADQCFTDMETKHNNVKKRAGTMGSTDDEQKALGEVGDLRGISEHLDHVRSKSVSVLHSDKP